MTNEWKTMPQDMGVYVLTYPCTPWSNSALPERCQPGRRAVCPPERLTLVQAWQEPGIPRQGGRAHEDRRAHRTVDDAPCLRHGVCGRHGRHHPPRALMTKLSFNPEITGSEVLRCTEENRVRRFRV